MKIISTLTFKNTLRDIHKNTDSRKFCFVIGAGASRNSGIPTGGELANKWFAEIKKDWLTDTELKIWVKEQRIDQKDLAASYGSIYRKRFENDKTSGYDFLVQEMKSATPSFGHIVLAQILSRTPGHCVLTTNFDSLVESSVYQFTDKTPLVCGHESLSGYARPSQTHPLVVKIHRDLLMAPKSDPDEINQLEPGWKEPLDHIFSNHIPVIIGYGGNDGSLMSYFEKMNKPSNFFWCGINESSISERIKKLITVQDGRFVKIDGFDELMQELLLVFPEIGPIEEELTLITNKRIHIARRQLENIINLESKRKLEFVEMNSDIKEKELSALEYSTLADQEPDYSKRKQIYLKAIEAYPNTAWLWWKFTYFLQYEYHDFEALDLYYSRALELNPNQGGLLSNYATYLNRFKKDYKQAEVFYLKAIEVENNAHNNASYASFLKSNKGNFEQAKEFFLKAIAMNSVEGIYYGNYAQILLEQGEKENAEKFIQLAFTNSEENDLLIELWFYRYAHYPEHLSEAKKKIEELLSKNIRSLGWNFEENITQAIKDGHPNPEQLRELAERITSE